MNLTIIYAVNIVTIIIAVTRCVSLFENQRDEKHAGKIAFFAEILLIVSAIYTGIVYTWKDVLMLLVLSIGTLIVVTLTMAIVSSLLKKHSR